MELADFAGQRGSPSSFHTMSTFVYVSLTSFQRLPCDRLHPVVTAKLPSDLMTMQSKAARLVYSRR